MKNRRILLLSLPAILVLASCHARNTTSESIADSTTSEESIPSSSESQPSSSSSESSSSSSSSSSSTKDQSQLISEAELAFDEITSRYNAGIYRLSFNENRYIFVNDGFLSERRVQMERYGYSSEYTIYDGYAALNDGLIHMGNVRYYDSRLLGYAAKTSSLDESLELLEEVRPETFTFDINDWTYVYNTDNGFCFKTDSADIKKVYATLSGDGDGFVSHMGDVYLFIDANVNDMRISPSFPGYPSFSSNCKIDHFSEDEMNDDYMYYDYYQRRKQDASGSYMDSFNNFEYTLSGDGGVAGYYPWPSQGNKYWFLRPNADNGYNGLYQWDACFLDTGDITASYAAQMDELDSWRWEKVGENHWHRSIDSTIVDGIVYDLSFDLTLEYTPASELSRGSDLYDKGIFAIKQRAELKDAREDDGWSAPYKRRVNVEYIPFPTNGGTDYTFEVEHGGRWYRNGEPNYTMSFNNVDSSILDVYRNQLLTAGYKYIDGSYYFLDPTQYENVDGYWVRGICHKVDISYDDGALKIDHHLVDFDMFDGMGWSDWHQKKCQYINTLPLPSNGVDTVGFQDPYIDYGTYMSQDIYLASDNYQIDSYSYGNDLTSAGFQYSYNYNCYWKVMDDSVDDPYGLYYYEDYGDGNSCCSIIFVYLYNEYGYYSESFNNDRLHLVYRIQRSNPNDYIY